MLASRLHIHWARVVIELPQGAALGGGDWHDTNDMPFVTDANGLPMLPGSGIAGALKGVLTRNQLLDEKVIKKLFGQSCTQDPALSELSVDFGYLHNSQDVPVDGLILLSEIEKDSVLKLCKSGVIRQHAPHNQNGVALERGLHNRQHLPAGARFTIELKIESKSESSTVATCMEALINALQHPACRLGGGKNSGIGAIQLIRWQERSFDLSKEKDMTAWMAWPKRACEEAKGEDTENLAWTILPTPSTELPKESYENVHQLDLTLRMAGYWRVGNGDPNDKLLTVNTPSQEQNDAMHPLVEAGIIWKKTEAPSVEGQPKGSTIEYIVVPGSAIKGVLAHQMAFEINCATQQWVSTTPRLTARPLELDALLGNASDSAAEDAKTKSVGIGSFWLQDLLIPIGEVKARYMTYNVIDQLNKGVVPGGLFTEKVLLPHVLKIKGYYLADNTIADDAKKSQAIALEALNTSLEMLKDGRLNLGAHAAAGHGYSDGGSVCWNPPLPATADPVETLLQGAVA